MFRYGHRLFSIVSIGLILIAMFHAIGHFVAPPYESFLSPLLGAMQAYRFELMLGSPSMMDIYDGLDLAVPILLLWVGTSNLLIARYTGLRDKLMRRICTLNILGVLMLVVLFGVFQMVTLAICLGIVDVLFVITRFRLRRSRLLRGPNTATAPTTQF